MRIHIDSEIGAAVSEVRVGNVYPQRGGRGAKYGRTMVVLAITTPTERWEGESVLLMVLRKDGTPHGVTSYGLHAVEEWTPIAFVEGLDDIDLTMRAVT